MVVQRFVMQALRGEPLTVYGDGTQRRSFTWVGDVVNALVSLSEHGGAYGSVFNVGHTKDITIHDLAQLVKTMTGSASPIVFVPYDEAYQKGFEDMRRRMPDISRISALIGYKPRVSLREMLEQTIASSCPA